MSQLCNDSTSCRPGFRTSRRFGFPTTCMVVEGANDINRKLESYYLTFREVPGNFLVSFCIYYPSLSCAKKGNRNMKSIGVGVLHSFKEGDRIGHLLGAYPSMKPTVWRSPEEFKSGIPQSIPQVGIIGRWSPDSKMSEMIYWMKTRFPGVVILAHTMQPEDILPAFLAGANGYMHQNSLESIGECVQKVIENGFYIPPEHGRIFIDQMIQSNKLYQAFVNANITPREVEIIRMQISEKNRFQAARKMGVEVTTVKSHNRLILKKLGMSRMKDVIRTYGQCLESEYQSLAYAG